MTTYPQAQAIQEYISKAQRIVIVQSDAPDGDSMGSALALEQILEDMGKQTFLYCGVSISGYLTYLTGWDRVFHDLPSQFDLSIIVDTSADKLLQKMDSAGQKGWLKSKPCIVIDHHDLTEGLSYADITCNQPAVAAGEVIYELAQQLKWPLNTIARNMLATAILSDSLGLTTSATTARSIHIIGELVEQGVSIPQLEEKRREMSRKSPELVRYKGELLQRIEYSSDNRVATVTIPWEEIQTYSPHYNPSVLVLDDMRLTTKTDIAIAFKLYSDGHMTAKIRSNYGKPIAGLLAEHFGGGGHAYASGFKISLGDKPFNEIKSECIAYATHLLDNLTQEKPDEAIQHSDS